MGNSVIVVEHDKDMMLAADYVIDMGPKAGRLGGEVVFCGNPVRDASNRNDDFAVSERRDENRSTRQAKKRKWKIYLAERSEGK